MNEDGTGTDRGDIGVRELASMTRREFVTAGVVAGATFALAGTTGCAGALSSADEVDTPSTTYGGERQMSKRVLVGYATRTGSTVGVAEAIGETLGQRGFAVDVKPLKEGPSLEGYDAVVLGSAVNGGQWLPEATGFVQENRATLRDLPVAAFCVHIMNLGDDAKSRAKRLAYLDRVREHVTPVAEGYFAGKGPTAEDTSLIMRWAFRTFGGGGEGDCRAWGEIRDWGGALFSESPGS